MVRVRRYNYPQQFPDLATFFSGLERIILSGAYSLSREVEVFEHAFAAFCGTNFARGINTGTDALVVALRSLGVGPGDEVITHANTFNATVTAIHLAGATPVLVDAREDTFLMDTSQVAGVISPRTRVVMPVHLYGKPTPMRDIIALASRCGALVVEDAAQAHGAKINGQHVGAFGVAGCFSFHPSKNLAAMGDGGAIVTNDPQLAATIELQRNLGQAGQNNHVVIGLNSRLDGLQAYALKHKLEYLDEWNIARNAVAGKYRELMQDLPVTFQACSDDELHVYHLFAIRTTYRNALLQHLMSRGIDAVIRYPTPIHLQKSFAQYGWREAQFPVAEALAKELLCLPIRPDLTDEEIECVTSTIQEFFDNHTPSRLDSETLTHA